MIMRALAIIFLLAAMPVAALAEVVFNDSLAMADATVKLRAETRGKVLAKGGVMVEFIVDGKSLGSVLSGGDGIAYREHRFARPGIYNVTARIKKEEASGRILVLGPSDTVVLVEVEGSLVKQDLMKRLPRPDGAETLRLLGGRYPIAYLAGGLPGREATKKWLRENGFPDAPLIDMGEDLFRGLVKNGVRVKAVIGSDDIASRARKTGAEVFVFGKGKLPKGAQRVKSWAQVRKALLEE